MGGEKVHADPQGTCPIGRLIPDFCFWIAPYLPNPGLSRNGKFLLPSINVNVGRAVATNPGQPNIDTRHLQAKRATHRLDPAFDIFDRAWADDGLFAWTGADCA